MFTGIIRHLGRLAQVSPAAQGRRIVVAAADLVGELSEGDSVAVNGVCLTVTEVVGDGFAAFVGAETCARTTLGALQPGALLNLEPALRAGQELGGHIVQGHVDGVGHLKATQPEGETLRMTFSAPEELLVEMIPRGSVAVEGISLTLTHVSEEDFAVAVIPYTWEHTNLRALSPGDAVNIETDLIGKYVRRFVQAQTGSSGLTREFLREHGYL